jgi:hypothetical protein
VLNYQGVPLAADQGLVKWTAVAGGIFTTKYLITEHAVEPPGGYLEKLVGPAVGPENTQGSILNGDNFTEIIKGLTPYAVDSIWPVRLRMLLVRGNRLLRASAVTFSIHRRPGKSGATGFFLKLKKMGFGNQQVAAAAHAVIPHARTPVLTKKRQVIVSFT